MTTHWTLQSIGTSYWPSGYPESQQRDRHREVLRIGPHVRDRVELVAEDLAIAGAGDRCRPHPVAAVNRCAPAASRRVSVQRIGRSAGTSRGETRQHLFGIHVELRPEPTADLGRDDAHVMRRQTERLGYGSGNSVGDLRRRVERHRCWTRAASRPARNAARLPPGIRRLVHELVAHNDGRLLVPWLSRWPVGDPSKFEDTGPPVSCQPGVQHVRIEVVVNLCPRRTPPLLGR